jgi:MFS family permease
VRGLLVALIPSLMKGSIWLVYADLVLISVATAFFRPAMFAIVPSVVSQRNLLAANSFFAAMETGTEIFGPALAGLLALAKGYSFLVYLDAATYLVSAVCMLGLDLSVVRPRGVSGTARDEIIAQVLEGFRYIRRDRCQWQLFLLIFPSVLVGAGLNALQTPLAKGEVGINDAEFGTFQSVWGIGFLLASLLLGWFGQGIPRSVLIVGGFLLGSVLTGWMSQSESFEALLLSGFAVGFASTLNYVGVATALMQVTPKHILGRVISLRQFALSWVRVSAPLLFGSLADLVGVRESVLLMALVGAGGTAVVAFGARPMWEMDMEGGAAVLSAGGNRLVCSYAFGYDLVDQLKLNTLAVFFVIIGILALLVHSGLQAVWLVVGTALVYGLGVLLKSAPLRGALNIYERLFDNHRMAKKSLRTR